MRSKLVALVTALCLAGLLKAQDERSQLPNNTHSLAQFATSNFSNAAKSCALPGLLPSAKGPSAQWQSLLRTLRNQPQSPPSQAAPQSMRSLPIVSTGNDGTMDQSFSFSLPDGVFISGTINNVPSVPPPGGVTVSISAQSSTGATYTGSVNQSQHTYSILVADNDTYSLHVCVMLSQFTPPLSVSSSTFTYNDVSGGGGNPNVVVIGDTTHDVTLPSLTTHVVSGSLLNPDSRFQSNILMFATQDGMLGGFALVAPAPFPPTYQANLFDGTYVAALTEATMGGSVTSLVLDNLTVSGGDVMKDFTSPSTSAISGAVTMNDGSPAQGLIAFIDVNAPMPVNGCANPPTNTAFAALDSGGHYNVNVGSGNTYYPATIVNANPGTLLTQFSSLSASLVTPLDLTANFSEPPEPSTVAFTFLVTDSSGAFLTGANVDGSTMNITGVFGADADLISAAYVNSAMTDDTGTVTLPVLNGMNYTVGASPPRQ